MSIYSHIAFRNFQNCGESVSSVEGGVVGTAGFDEIIATTYTGLNVLFSLRLRSFLGLR